MSGQTGHLSDALARASETNLVNVFLDDGSWMAFAVIRSNRLRLVSKDFVLEFVFAAQLAQAIFGSMPQRMDIPYRRKGRMSSLAIRWGRDMG